MFKLEARELRSTRNVFIAQGELGMGEVGKTIHDSLLGSPTITKGKCKSCGSPLELYELDFRRSEKVMKCIRCSMLHFYRKDIIGKWRLHKAQKAEMPPR